MKVIERLNLDHAEKLRYFLSKADTVPNERDRQKVVVQITQNLSSRVRNAHAFELPSLYIPDFSTPSCKIENILEATCSEMQQTINQSVQNNLNKLERDCKSVDAKISELLGADAIVRAKNRKAATYGLLTFGTSLLGPLLLLVFFVHRAGLLTKSVHLLASTSGAPPPAELHAAIGWLGDTCDALVAPEAAAAGTAASAADSATPGLLTAPVDPGLLTLPQFLLGTLGYFLTLQLASRLLWRCEPCFTKREVANLVATQKHVMGDLLELKVRLYKLYLDQCSSEVQ